MLFYLTGQQRGSCVRVFWTHLNRHVTASSRTPAAFTADKTLALAHDHCKEADLADAMKVITVIVYTSLLLLSNASDAIAGDVRVEEVSVTGAIDCLTSADWFVTSTTGPCSNFVPPSRVRVGETFSANGKTFKIGIVIASQAEEDMLTDGLNIKKGEWTCAAAEGEDQIPTGSDEVRNRTWLNMRKCEPVASQPSAADNKVRPLQVITAEEFLAVSESHQLMFVAGILEGMSFASSGMKNYDKWVACVRKTPMGDLMKEVRTHFETNLEAKKHPVPWSVVAVIGARDCDRGTP